MSRLGLSGDIIVIDGNELVKICNTNQDRFLRNVAKQTNFVNPFISAVPVIEQFLVDNKNSIRMPLIRSKNSIEWLSDCSIEQINDFVELLEGYFNSIVQSSTLSVFNYSAWKSKITELQGLIIDIDLLEILEYIKNIKFSQEFYYGTNHGDFTLSNLFIFSKNGSVAVDAIDFLDSFIQSPINDMVKMRQDTKHLWTITLCKHASSIDYNKVLILLNFIDSKISSIIKCNSNLSEFYYPFQILNLIRIIPYNKDIEVFAHLKQEIQGLFNEFSTTDALCR